MHGKLYTISGAPVMDMTAGRAAVQRSGRASAAQWLCGRISSGILPCRSPLCVSHASVVSIARAIWSAVRVKS
jgi:hypothetical protein